MLPVVFSEELCRNVFVNRNNFEMETTLERGYIILE